MVVVLDSALNANLFFGVAYKFSEQFLPLIILLVTFFTHKTAFSGMRCIHFNFSRKSRFVS